MPHACIGADVIVGFPGEQNQDFEDTYAFIRDKDISYLHVFTYSERADTLAVEMDQSIPIHVRKQRNKRLRILSDKKNQTFIKSQMGSTQRVLFENSKRDGYVEGYTENYIPVIANGSNFESNLIREINLSSINTDGKVVVKPIPMFEGVIQE